MNLTGQTFGRWTVQYEAEPKYNKRGYIIRRWHCQCNCSDATEKDIAESELTNGRSKSCGCLQREITSKRMDKKRDLTGQTFGRWLVLERGEDHIAPNGKREKTWHCRCNCEDKTERDVLERSLVNGYSLSCGCLQREKVKEPNYANRKSNEYDLSGEYGIGYTSKGEEFYFDLEDYEKIKDYCWHKKQPDGYICAYQYEARNHIILSRLIMNVLSADRWLLVDHKNHNKSDNRKCNLRIANNSQNMMNKHIISTNTSGVMGVCWRNEHQRWRAYISTNGKQIYLGEYKEFEDAVKARRDAENKYFGEYSYSNSVAINS